MVCLSSLVGSNESHVAYNAAAALGLGVAAALRERMLKDPRILRRLEVVGRWPGPAVASRKSSTQPFHILSFLADIGIRRGDPGIEDVAAIVLDTMDERSMPLLPSREGVMGWAFCDAPTTLYALARMGFEDPRIAAGIDFIASKVGAQGCGCTVSPSFGSWRGPGRAGDPCPYATMAVLRLLSVAPEGREAPLRSCAATLLGLWEQSRHLHPYIFYMGDDFRKLKLPNFWYDILAVADALSLSPAGRDDPRFKEILSLILAKEGGDGFYPETTYLPWKDFDFGQKKLPSEWMAFFILRLASRTSPPRGSPRSA